MSIHLKRTPTILEPDPSRVLLRPFSPGSPERVAMIIARIMAIPEDGVGAILDAVTAEFSERHQQIRHLFLERFEQVRELVATNRGIDRTKTAPDRILFPGRVLPGIRCPVQSIDGPAS